MMRNRKEMEQVWDDHIPMFKLGNRGSVFLIVVLAFVSYCVSLDGDFVFDDSEAVVNNVDVRPTTPLNKIWYNDFWGTRLNNTASHKSYRPFTILVFRLIRYYYGELSPHPFHVANITMHCLVSVLTYFTNKIIFGHYCPRASLLCSLMFATLPVHTECVAGIVGLAELLSGTFGLIAFMIYSYSCNYEYGCYTCSVALPSISCILCIIAMLCKEQGISVIGMCIAYDVINSIKPTDSGSLKYLLISAFTKSSNSPFKSGKFKLMIKKFLPIPSAKKFDRLCSLVWVARFCILRLFVSTIFALIAIRFRFWWMGSQLPTFQRVDNPAAFENNFLTRVFNYSYIYSLNIYLLIYPKWLCFDWSMGCVPLVYATTFDPRMLVVFTFWICLIFFIYCIFEHNGITRRALMIGTSSMIILFLPASNMLFSVGFVVAERVLYLPSLGYCIIVVVGIQIICYETDSKILVKLLTFGMLTTFVFRSIHRSAEWRSEQELFESALLVCPLNAKVHYNLAKIAADKGDFTTAIYRYHEAIMLNPKYDQAMNNLANILKDQGKLEQASFFLTKAIQLRPDFAAAWMNLGIVSTNLKQYDKAEHCYLIALQHRTKFPDCYYNLGNLYLEIGRNTDALKAWRNAIAQKRNHLVAWNNIILMLDTMGKYEEALEMESKAISTFPNEASIFFNLANVHGKLNNFEQSEKYFLRAIQLKNDYPLYYVNLGVLYHRWNKFCNAKEEYKKALKLDPNLKSAIRNLQRLEESINVISCD